MTQTTVPSWALNHLRDHLPAQAPILNAVLHRRGIVVANTRLGAAVVTKRWFGEPHMQFLPNPRERVAFQCQVCAENLEFRRLDLPTIVHCGLCGSKYAVDAAGLAQLRERLEWSGSATLSVAEIPSRAHPTLAGPAHEANPRAAAEAGAPFTFQGFTLHSRQVQLKGGSSRPIYFFAKSKPKSGTPTAKPEGFHVGVNERTGLPFLKRGTTGDGEDLTPEPEHKYRPQCAALTDAGHQCRNSARGTSRYCSSHFGYQPPVLAKAAAKREDTAPRVRAAPDTLPSVRRKS